MNRGVRILLVLLPTILAVGYLLFRAYERDYFYSPPAHPTSSDDFLSVGEWFDLYANALWSLPVFFLAVLVYRQNKSAIGRFLVAALVFPWALAVLAPTVFPANAGHWLWHSLSLVFLGPIVFSLTGLIVFFLEKKKPNQPPEPTR